MTEKESMFRTQLACHRAYAQRKKTNVIYLSSDKPSEKGVKRMPTSIVVIIEMIPT